MVSYIRNQKKRIVRRIYSRRVPLTIAKKKSDTICKQGNHCNLYNQGNTGNNGNSRNVSNVKNVTIIRSIITLVMIATIVNTGTDPYNHGTHNNITH